MAWTVNFEPRALAELKKLDRKRRSGLSAFSKSASLERAIRAGTESLWTGDRVGLWRYRIGNYGVVGRIEDDSRTVLVLRVAHRKDVYR